jgi:rRNA maturation endonuclease Nob1
MKKIIVLIIALAVNIGFVSAMEISVISEKSYTTVPVKGGDDDLKSRIKELKQRRKALREEEKILDQKLRIKRLEKQANSHVRRNKHKQVELDHQ